MNDNLRLVRHYTLIFVFGSSLGLSITTYFELRDLRYEYWREAIRNEVRYTSIVEAMNLNSELCLGASINGMLDSDKMKKEQQKKSNLF